MSENWCPKHGYFGEACIGCLREALVSEYEKGKLEGFQLGLDKRDEQIRTGTLPRGIEPEVKKSMTVMQAHPPPNAEVDEVGGLPPPDADTQRLED